MIRRSCSCKNGGKWVPGTGDSRLRGLEVRISLACWGTERKPEFQKCGEPGHRGRRGGRREIHISQTREALKSQSKGTGLIKGS